MTGQLRDRDGRVGQHARGLEVHPPQLHGVGGSDHAGVRHLKPGHERCRHLPSVHRLFERLLPPPEDDDEDHQEGEADARHHRAHHPHQVGAGGLAGDQVAVDTATVARSCRGSGGTGGVGLWKYFRIGCLLFQKGYNQKLASLI